MATINGRHLKMNKFPKTVKHPPYSTNSCFLVQSPAMALTPGVRLGPYEIVAPLGAGGMGQVFRARDTRLNRTGAIKVLTPRLAADPEFQRRFQIEARAVSGLSHPHICTLFDVG